jgi:hypothetical protein
MKINTQVDNNFHGDKDINFEQTLIMRVPLEQSYVCILEAQYSIPTIGVIEFQFVPILNFLLEN